MRFEDLSIGIDIEDIARFENADDAFKKRIFTQSEIEYCSSKVFPAQHYAARFCAKEALFKAISGFGERGIEFNKMEVYHENGVPCFRFLNNLEKKYKVKLSLSHDKTKAIAYVIIFKSNEDKK